MIVCLFALMSLRLFLSTDEAYVSDGQLTDFEKKIGIKDKSESGYALSERIIMEAEAENLDIIVCFRGPPLKPGTISGIRTFVDMLEGREDYKEMAAMISPHISHLDGKKGKMFCRKIGKEENEMTDVFDVTILNGSDGYSVSLVSYTVMFVNIQNIQ